MVCTTKVNWYCHPNDDTIVFLGACFVKLNSTFAKIICKFSGGWDQFHEYWLVFQVQLLKLVVITLALGLRPKQGLARLRAEKEAQESHLMFSRV